MAIRTGLESKEGRRAPADVTWRPEPPEVAEWVRAVAVPVGLDPSASVDDLEPLRASLAGARVVGLGEATHGTSDFFRFKHRMVRYLVERLGFTAFAIEGFPGECLVLDRYVRGAEVGDVRDAVRMIYGGGSPWDVEEVLALVEWLREHNRTAERKIGFYGLDVHGTSGAVLLVRYLRTVDTDLADRAEAIVSAFSTSLRVLRFQQLPSDEQARALRQLDELIDSLDRERGRLAAGSSDKQWADARRAAEGIRQVASMPLPYDAPARLVPRERGQANLVLSLLDLEGADGKLVIWAHNGHVQKGEWYRGVPACGEYLHQTLGDDYVVVAAGFSHGSFRAVDMENGGRRVFTVAPAPAGSLDRAFATHGPDSFVIDLRTAPPTVAGWIASGAPQRSIGGGFSDRPDALQWTERPASQSFDLIAFSRETEACRPFDSAAPGTPLDPDVPIEPQPQPVNLDFTDWTDAGAPRGWTGSMAQAPVAYAVSRVDDGPGRVRIGRPEGAFLGGSATLRQHLDASSLRGGTVVLSAHLGSGPTAVERDAELFIEARGEPDPGGLTAPRPLVEAFAATRATGGPVSVALRVPADAKMLAFGIRLVGPGWVEIGPVDWRLEQG